jgi:hypothetical protein
MKKDFVPDSFQNLRDWASNLFDQIAIQGPVLGWTAAQVTAFQTPVGSIRDAAQEVLDKQQDLDMAVGALRQKLHTLLPGVRRDINNLKSMPDYHEGIGQDLGIVTPAEQPIDPVTYQPDLKVQMMNGTPRLMGKKRGVDSFNIYVRLAGETTWRLLVAKRVRFPYDDDSPVAHPGTPEQREYRISGMIADNEIGQPSDIATAVVPG